MSGYHVLVDLDNDWTNSRNCVSVAWSCDPSSCLDRLMSNTAFVILSKVLARLDVIHGLLSYILVLPNTTLYRTLK